MKFKTAYGSEISLAVVKAIQKNKEYLSEVDGLIGDGDHGINMNKGFTMFEEKLGEQKLDLFNAFKMLGRTLLSDIGGSMGPLYGTFFIEMGKKTKGLEEVNENLFSEMLEAAVNGIQEIGNAQVGDKTLIDALSPARDAFKKAIEDKKSFKEGIEDMKVASNKGRDNTKDMIAKLGRASRLGERSRGVVDAGATSCAIIINALGDKVTEILED